MNETVPLQQLFNNRIFRVPDYQRGYAWEQQQVGEFLDDLALLGATRRHYTGTIVLHQPPNAKERMDDAGTSYVEAHIVDGQQRLTTIVLLLNEISRALRAYESSRSLAEGVRKSYVEVGDIDGRPLHKLSLNANTDDFFKGSVLPEKEDVAGPPVASARRLADAKRQIAGYLKEAEGGPANHEQWLRDLYGKITTRLHFNLYEVDNEAEVGVIFEVMNDRGKPLTDLEKVKNYLLYAASSLDAVEQASRDELAASVNRAWADILTRLMDAGLSSPANEDNLLRADWIMRYDPQSRRWEGSKSIRSRFTLRKSDQAQLLSQLHQYVDGLRESSVCYCDALKPGRTTAFNAFSGSVRDDIIFWNLRFVRIGVTASFLPMLMAVRTRWSSEPEKYLETVRLCELLAFRIYRIARSNSNYKQSAMFHLAFRVVQGMDVKEAIRETKRCCNDAWLEQMVAIFMDPEVPQNRYGWSGLKYFLYEYEQQLASARGGSPKIPWMDVFRADIRDTIEHVLPQSIGDRPYWQERFDAAKHEEYLHDIGNLALTKGNPTLSNKSFPEKKGEPGMSTYCYANAPLFQEQDLALLDEWKPESIEKRRAKLLSWARERWHVDFSDVSSDASAAEPDDEEDDDASEDAEEEVV